jgi:hypothetical protein
MGERWGNMSERDLLEKPGLRWEDNIELNLQKIESGPD